MQPQGPYTHLICMYEDYIEALSDYEDHVRHRLQVQGLNVQLSRPDTHTHALGGVFVRTTPFVQPSPYDYQSP